MSLLLRKRWSRLAVHAVAASLLARLLAVALHVAPLSQIGIGDGGGSFRTILICSAHGLRSVAVDDQGNVIDAPPPADPGKSAHACPICLAVGGCGLAVPPNTSSIHAPTTAVLIAWRPLQGTATSPLAAVHRNRGPPPSAAV